MERALREANEWRAKKEVAPLVTQNLVLELNDLVRELNENTKRLTVQTAQVETAVHVFRASSERSANVMVWLTAVIAALTLAVVALALVTAL